MTSVRLRQAEEVFSPLEQRVIEAVLRDAAVAPKPYEEMTLQEGLGWVVSRYRDEVRRLGLL